MRNITHIVVHCTATAQNATVKGILNYWKSVLKWKSPGYHYLIEANGQIHSLQPEEKPTNGVAGHNANSVHVSYIGGVDAKGKAVDNRTLEQKASMLLILRKLRRNYPEAVICGHRDFPGVKKDCPSFDARKEYKDL